MSETCIVCGEPASEDHFYVTIPIGRFHLCDKHWNEGKVLVERTDKGEVFLIVSGITQRLRLWPKNP